MGFNSESGLAVGTALEGFSVTENPTAPGGEVTASISIVNTHEELQESLSMSFEAQGRYGFYSGSAKTKFSESTKFNSTSTFLVARCIVENALRRGKNFAVTPGAKALLTPEGFDAFKNAFGDSFVRGLQTGGEFYAVIRITSISTSTQSELAATLQAEANGLVVGGSFKGAFTTANESASTRSEFAATMYQRAGTGTQIAPTVTIEDVIKRFQEFPAIAHANAAAYEVEVATYDTLPLPLPTPEEREDFLFALADARERKLRYIQTRNDLEFVRHHPEFFQDPPPAQTLDGAVQAYTTLINAVMAHAIKLSRGQINPPQVFDPALLSPPIAEPAPIPLMRLTPPPAVVQIPAWFTERQVFPVPPVVSLGGLPSASQLGLRVHWFFDRKPKSPSFPRPSGHITKILPPPGSQVQAGSTIEIHAEHIVPPGTPLGIEEKFQSQPGQFE